MKCMDKIDIKECKAACCGYVPIHKDIVKKHVKKLHKNAEKLATLGNMEIWTQKGVCGFLDKDYKCKIYDDRPEVCRLMGSEEKDHPLLKCSFLNQISDDEIKSYMKKMSINI